MKQRSKTQAVARDWDELEGVFTPGLVPNVRAVVAACKAVTQRGHEYVKRSFDAPSRAVRSTTRSMSGRYPSLKMGTTIQFESNSLEALAILKLEADDSTIAYVDQPDPVKIQYTRNGRRHSHQQTPDFLRVQEGQVTLIECKPLDQIVARNARDAEYYVLEGHQWRCAALQTAAAEMGFAHEVWCEQTFSPIEMRNLRMLIDYLRADVRLEGYDKAREALVQFLSAKARATISEVLRELGSHVSVDHIYRAIALRDVAFDWQATSLADAEACQLYRDDHTLKAFLGMEIARVPPERRIEAAGVELAEGNHVKWDGKIWRVLNFGATSVMLGRGDVHFPMPREVLDNLIKDGLLESADEQPRVGISDAAYRVLARARPNDLRTANLRHKRLLPYLGTGRSPQDRTLRRFLASYRAAEREHGTGFVGLIPGFSSSGNRKPRLIKDVINAALSVAAEHYANCSNKSKKVVYALLAAECDAKALPLPCYSWFCKFLDKLPKYKTVRARSGAKGAYLLEPRVQVDDERVDGEPDRPWERAHADHTEINVETVFGETGEGLGRAWITILIDHFSRRVLAFHLTYDPPSYRSVLMVMRKCVQRWGRLPETILVDGGKEFRSVWFQTTCAIYNVTILYRPTGKPRFGSQGERLFRTLDSILFHSLSGNTQLRKNVRQMTDEVDPDRHAVWTLPELSKLVEKFLFEQYDSSDHSELLVSPRHMYQRGMERHGTRPVRLIPYNRQFVITTCPSTVKGTAKVQPDGLKVEYVMYSHPGLEKHVGASVPVRYDPFDKSKAWAYVHGEWLELRTRHRNLLRLFTERSLELAVAEWKKRRSLVSKKRLNEPTLVKFLQEILETETLLKERRRAAEERRLRSMAGDDADAVEDSDASSPATAAFISTDEPDVDGDAFSLEPDSIQVLKAA